MFEVLTIDEAEELGARLYTGYVNLALAHGAKSDIATETFEVHAMAVRQQDDLNFKAIGL